MIDIKRMKASHEKFVRANLRMLEEGAQFGADHAEQHIQKFPLFKRRTGTLQDNTKARVVRIRGGRLIRIQSKGKANKYASVIDTGSKAHVILPRRKKFLAFIGRDGHMVFARKVNHPGTRPYKYGWRAAYSTYRVLGRFLDSEMARIARQRF